MELATTLKGQSIQNRIREVGINPNYWYPVEWASQVKPGEVRSVMIWRQAIALYRDTQGSLHALADACPHKGVELHKGEVQGSNLACPYHGWEFDGDGNCVNIPYFPKDQKLPCAKAQSYPVQEKYEIVWIFPGDPNLAEYQSPPEVPEFDHPDWFVVRIPGKFEAHFSICNENTMDVFHGFLHKDLQGWFDPVLLNLQQTESGVAADYRVSYQGWLTKLIGIGKEGTGVITRTVSIRYQYPHYHSALEDVSSLYLMRSPVESGLTRSFSLMFIRLPLPNWLLKGPLKNLIEKLILKHIFLKFLHQDVEMMESEQRNYIGNPKRQYIEVNPAIIALQRVIIGQYEKFMQQSKQPFNQTNGGYKASLTLAEMVKSE
ncbi:MAG: aromatic ring-hydroxylating dioxygenase subunit alpha [Leptolyngbyaceae cyanobacterium MO_188.B28]|nr:aromatic ring-hydroxylating dioxygenase subunit alpha [Leptolyngbyaceae cyanobacterium MO_188.B28]